MSLPAIRPDETAGQWMVRTGLPFHRYRERTRIDRPRPGAFPRVPLFQESEPDPFWILVGCQLVNRATWKVAGPIHAELKRRYPDGRSLALADGRVLRPLLHPLGFVSRRWRTLRDFAAVWTMNYMDSNVTSSRVSVLPGCGRYAADSFSIFVEGRRDVAPEDRRLREFLADRSVSCRA